MLAKRLKDRGYQVKELGWDLCVKGGIILGGLWVKLQETSYNALVEGFHGDQNAKRPYLIFTMQVTILF
jgi:hypothetical protein